MAHYEALYRRKCQSPYHWDEIGEGNILGPDLIQETIDIIKRVRERMKATQGIMRRVYPLALHPHLSRVYEVFHVSMLQNSVSNPNHVLETEPIDLSQNIFFI
ncbi:hypothetical protein ABFS83_14G127100 [Erythranthe nasuta]